MASFQGQNGLIFMALPQESQGLFEAQGLKVHYTGVGKIKTTFAATKLIQELKPDFVLNLGTAGSRKFKQGEIVECTRFVQRDPLFAEFSQKVFETTAITTLPQVTCGTADFVDYDEPKVQCDVYDMEAYALAYVCDQFKVKFNSIKYITDSSDQNAVKDWKANLSLASRALLQKVPGSFFP